MKNDASMKILGHLFALDRYRPFRTLGTASMSAGKKIHVHPWPLPEEANRF
jgi:hypothetical protein